MPEAHKRAYKHPKYKTSYRVKCLAFKPHLVPNNMPVYRVAYFANGNDVDTVIVNGEVLMENRQVKTVIEAEVLDLAQKAIEDALKRTNLLHLLAIPDRFWGVTKSLTN